MERTEDANSSFASPLPAGRTYRLWTDKEIRYLKQHRADGAEMIAHALGRSISSVQAKAFQLGVSLYRVPELAACPICGERPIRPRTGAGRYGMCITCWERAKAENMREKAAEDRARRDYDAYRHQKDGARTPRRHA